MTDIEIARANTMLPIADIAEKIKIEADELELYGKYKAKLSMKKLKELQKKVEIPEKRGKLILVTAVTPTAAGEGKSTVSIGLGDGLRKIGKNASIALREPSLGPCFGVKGGACGGGFAQIVPMEDINLHFTGDIHAISIANNLIAALIDNHIQQGNALGIDPRTVFWKRCLDLNDRSLRSIVVGLGGRIDGVPREEHFTIAVASEIMAIVCLSKNITELKERISRIIIAQDYNRQNIEFGKLECTGAVAALLKDAIRLRSRRPLCQHCARLQQHKCDFMRTCFKRLCRYGSRFCRRFGRRKVYGYKMQDGGNRTVCRCNCCYNSRLQNARRSA